MNRNFVLPIVFVVVLVSVILVSANMTYVTSGSKSNYVIKVDLEEGWNLISYFSLEGITSNSELKASDINAVYAYFPSRKEYVRVHPNLERDKFSLMSSQEREDSRYYSFWVYSNKRGSLEYFSPETTELPSFRLNSGWNFISVYPGMTDITIDLIKGSCQINKIYLWNPNQRWELFSSSNDFEKSYEGYGVIVNVANNCTFGALSHDDPPPVIPSQ